MIVINVGIFPTTLITDGILGEIILITEGMLIGGSTTIIDGTLNEPLGPKSKQGKTIGGIETIFEGTGIVGICRDGKSGNVGILISKGAVSSPVVGSVTIVLFTGVCTIAHLLLEIVTIGSIVAFAAYRWLPLVAVVVNSPSPKSNLKLVKVPSITILYSANMPDAGSLLTIAKSKVNCGHV